MRLVVANFVPVALNTDRLPDTETGRFFRTLMKRWPQGLWVVTPEGKTLGFHYHQPTGTDNFKQNQQRWVDGTREMLETSVKAVGPLPRRDVKGVNPFPDRGVGFTKTGQVRLALSVIATRSGKQEGPPVIDSFLLTPEDWAAFAPPATQTEWTLAEATVKKFAPMLSPLTDSIFVPRADDVTKATVTAKVIRQVNGLDVIRYTGTWQSRHLRDGNAKFPIDASANGEAIGVYDPLTKNMQSLTWVLRGTYHKAADAPMTPTAIIVEWAAKE